MPAVKRNAGIIYRCPMCFMTLTDIVIDLYDDDRYHCVKCGYTATHRELLLHYEQIRSRYKMRKRRITLEEQRRL